MSSSRTAWTRAPRPLPLPLLLLLLLLLLLAVLTASACRHDIDVTAPADAAPPEIDSALDASNTPDADADAEVSDGPTPTCPAPERWPGALGALVVGPSGDVRRVIVPSDQSLLRYEKAGIGDFVPVSSVGALTPLPNDLSHLAATVDDKGQLHLLRADTSTPAEVDHAAHVGTSWKSLLHDGASFQQVRALALAAGQKRVLGVVYGVNASGWAVRLRYDPAQPQCPRLTSQTNSTARVRLLVADALFVESRSDAARLDIEWFEQYVQPKINDPPSFCAGPRAAWQDGYAHAAISAQPMVAKAGRIAILRPASPGGKARVDTIEVDGMLKRGSGITATESFGPHVAELLLDDKENLQAVMVIDKALVWLREGISSAWTAMPVASGTLPASMQPPPANAWLRAAFDGARLHLLLHDGSSLHYRCIER